MVSRRESLEYFKAMIECYGNVLSQKEKDELHAWEKQNLPSAVQVDSFPWERALGSSDWPGWEKHIGKFPID